MFFDASYFYQFFFFFFFSSRRRHTRYIGDWSSDVCSSDLAIRWVTANPAWALGLDSLIGTLEPGKIADVVVWSGDPFSVYSRAIQVYNDGWLVYDRNDPAHQPRTDFQLGQTPAAGGRNDR